MPARTPTPQQARSHYARQQALALMVLEALRRLFKVNPRPSVPQIAAVVARYQLASATVSSSTVAEWAGRPRVVVPEAFTGVSSFGFSVMEPIIATIDRVEPAPPVAVPDPWWTDPADILPALERLAVSEVQDAGRTASQVEIVATPTWQNYVRMLNPPSCARCAILAGRVYRDLEAFQRHPLCDCVMVPVQDWQDAHDSGLLSSPAALVEAGQVTGLSKADAQAVEDGADIAEVVNAHRGIVTVDSFGKRVKATTYGTTRRAAWRKANPSQRVRLRPESIYAIAKDRDDALRLLKLYGYIK